MYIIQYIAGMYIIQYIAGVYIIQYIAGVYKMLALVVLLWPLHDDVVSLHCSMSIVTWQLAMSLLLKVSSSKLEILACPGT